MKYIMILATSAICLLISCTKGNDVPSLDEKKEGRWAIRTYTEERYHPATNNVTRNEMQGRPGEYMDFSYNKVYVHFDSTGIMQWTSSIVDHKTLRIQGKKWNIVALDDSLFHLSLFERDSSRKIREVVRYELVRF